MDASANLLRAFETIARARRRPRRLDKDPTLQVLVRELVSARRRFGLSQAEVAARMWTTRSVVSRLESGRYVKPSLQTIDRYARAVGCKVEIRLRELPRL